MALGLDLSETLGILGRDVSDVVLEFLNWGTMVEGFLNHTLIALDPKVKDPKTVMEFRPISLCNVLYKLISKVFANRVKKVLNVTISHNQSAFISDKLITDNIMVVFELLHSMQSKQKGKKKYYGYEN